MVELGDVSVSHAGNTGRGAKVLADGNTCMGFADRGSVQVRLLMVVVVVLRIHQTSMVLLVLLVGLGLLNNVGRGRNG